MRVTAQKIRAAVASVTLLATALALFLLCSHVFYAKRAVVCVDSILAQSTQQLIVAYVERQPAAIINSPVQLCAILAKQFPYIDSITTRLIAPNTLHCAIEAHKPLIKLYGALVLTHAGLITEPHIFATCDVESLCSLCVEHAPEPMTYAHKELVCYAKALSPSLFARYQITWLDEYAIRFDDTTSPLFSILCNARTMPDDRKLSLCNQLLSSEAARQQGTGGRKTVQKRLIADVRFDNQIILFSERGGVTHG